MKRFITGFTLLEVIVALAVAAVGLAGVIKVAGGNAYNAQHLQQKTLAQWIAMNRISQLRARKEFPPIGSANGKMTFTDELEAKQGDWWYWKQETVKLPLTFPGLENELRQVTVTIYKDEDFKTSILASLTTYVARQQ